MKKIIYNRYIPIAAVCFFGLNVGFAQSNNPESASSRRSEIEAKIVDYQTGLSADEAKIQTNDFALDDKAFDEMVMAIQPLKEAMNMLDNSWAPLDRQQRVGLWLEVLSAIDTNLSSPFLATNAGPVAINGFIQPPAGYQGKVGLYGMLPPDTNDVAAYSYYISARKKYRVRRFTANIRTYLDRLNQEATDRFGMFLRANYSSSDSNRQEFYQLVNESTLSTSRQQELKQLFGTTH